MRRVVLALLAGALVGPAVAQETRLADVAKNIKLRPPSEEALFVDLTPGDRAVMDADSLVELTSALTEGTGLASSMLRDAGMDDTFYSRDWRFRMLVLCEELEQIGYSLAATQPPTSYTVPYLQVMDGVRECERAVESLRESLEVDQPLFGPAIRHFDNGQDLAAQSLEKMVAIRALESVKSAPSADDALETPLIIADFCAARAASGSAAYEACVADQERARREIVERFNFTVLLDEPTFNRIRNGCRSEWPVDLVGRDRCERQRIAQAR
jgi:hypothetical protein